MTTLQAMDIVYPVLFGLLLGHFGIKWIYLWIARRTMTPIPGHLNRMIRLIIGIDSLISLNEAAVVGLLAINTGANPSHDINQYRYIVVVLRSLLAALLTISILTHGIAIYLFWKLTHGMEQTTQRIRPMVYTLRPLSNVGLYAQRRRSVRSVESH